MPILRPNEFNSIQKNTTGAVQLEWGFPASFIRIKNDGPGIACLSFALTSAPTTGTGAQLTSGEDLTSVDFPGLSGIGYISTTTTQTVRVLALGM